MARPPVVIEGEAVPVPESEDQAQSLARLETLAGAGAPPGQEPAPAPDPEAIAAEALAGLFTTGGALIGLLGYAQTAALWSEPACAGLAHRLVPVLAKYAFGQRLIALIAAGGCVEELALVLYLAPLAAQTLRAVQADRAAQAELESEPETAPA